MCASAPHDFHLVADKNRLLLNGVNRRSRRHTLQAPRKTMSFLQKRSETSKPHLPPQPHNLTTALKTCRTMLRSGYTGVTSCTSMKKRGPDYFCTCVCVCAKEYGMNRTLRLSCEFCRCGSLDLHGAGSDNRR